MKVPLPRRIFLGCFKELKSFYDWYKQQVEKDPDYGKKRKPRKH